MAGAGTERPVIRYEDNAEPATETGWRCKTCKRFWSSRDSMAEHMARWCCCTEQPCGTSGCTGRAKRGWTGCDDCRRKADDERWAKLKRVEWDGEAPLVVWDDDRFFSSAEDIVYYCDDHGCTPADLRLVLAEPNNGRTFEMNEFLSDDLAEDQTLDADDIDAAVNKWIEDHSPISWTASNKAVTPESVMLHTDWEADRGNNVGDTPGKDER